VQYPFTSVSPLSAGTRFDKAISPWDGRNPAPGYDIGLDGVVHVGMLPDFVQEMSALGLTSDDLQPIFRGAEAYVRTWETADAWASSFDTESAKGVRGVCEVARKSLLANEDAGNPREVVVAMRELRSNHCRGIPTQM
jgi:hypothetical protein